jgi:soluble lytic murein transglycosylase-like protein
MKLKKRTRARLRRAALIATTVFAGVTMAVNALVRFVSGTGPWLLDPRHLQDKALALLAYARHRPVCLLVSERDPISQVPRAAARHGVDPDLLEAMVLVESGGHAHRISPTGACGPAQLQPSTARDLGVSDPFDPREGVDGGARYLRSMLDRYDGNRSLALAAYNAGPGVVHGSIPQNGETELYVQRVLTQWRVLREARRGMHRKSP